MQDYEAYVSALVGSGAIPNATHVWWAIRPSQKYPTLELRATDCCTRIEDALAVAALYRTLVRWLYRSAEVNSAIDVVDRAIAGENKWRAERYGVAGTFVTRQGRVATLQFLDDLIPHIEPDMDALQCRSEIDHCRSIITAGTSADAQMRIYAENEAQGADAAFLAVNRWI